MHKLMLVFHSPGRDQDFETRWSNEFVAKAERMPGLKRVAVSRLSRCLSGPADWVMLHEFFFEDRQALERAMASPEGQAAGDALMGFAADYVSVCLSEHLEEARNPDPPRTEP